MRACGPALHQVLIELLISAANSPGEHPDAVVLEARSLVDTNGQMMLCSAVCEKALAGDWGQSAAGKQAAKILGDAAAACIAPTASRRTPVHVLTALVEADALGGATLAVVPAPGMGQGGAW